MLGSAGNISRRESRRRSFDAVAGEPDESSRLKPLGPEDEEALSETASQISLYPDLISMRGLALFILTVVPCLGSLLFGMDFGLTAWLLVNIETYSDGGAKWFAIVGDSDLGRGVVGSSSPTGMAVSCLLASYFAEKLGRKVMLMGSALCYILGCTLTIISGDLKWDEVTGFVLLLLGRFIYGMGNTFSLITVPAYLSETVPSRLRGPMLSCMELFVVLGIALGFWAGGLTPYQVERGWRYFFGIPLALALLMGVGLFFIPRSPRWLISHGGSVQRVLTALRFVNPDATEDEAKDMIWRIRRLETGKRVDLFEEIKQGGAVNKAWKVSVLLICMQQLCGQTALLYYSGLLFTNTVCAMNASWGLNLIGAVKLMGALACSFLVEEAGRRRLLALSSAGMTVGMLLLVLDFFTGFSTSQIDKFTCVGILVVAFYFYLLSYSLGLGPVTWILLGELFPTEVKSTASSWALLLGNMLNVVVTLSVPLLVKRMTFIGVFAIFFIICLVCTFLMTKVIPETKGLTLEEIQIHLEDMSSRGIKNQKEGGEDSGRYSPASSMSGTDRRSRQATGGPVGGRPLDQGRSNNQEDGRSLP